MNCSGKIITSLIDKVPYSRFHFFIAFVSRSKMAFHGVAEKVINMRLESDGDKIGRCFPWPAGRIACTICRLLALNDFVYRVCPLGGSDASASVSILREQTDGVKICSCLPRLPLQRKWYWGAEQSTINMHEQIAEKLFTVALWYTLTAYL